MGISKEFLSLNKKRFEVVLIPLFIFILNVLIKMPYLTSRDIALDEPFTLYYAQQDISAIIEMLYSENNPPFHFFFLHYWMKLFGISAFSVRLPSLLFSAFTAVALYKIGTKFFSRFTGIVAALVFTFSTMHIFFSHEARVYPFFSMLTAASLYCFLSIFLNSNSKKYFYYLFIANLLLIYSHYFGFFVLMVEVGCLLLWFKQRVLIKPFLILFLLIGIAYIPNLLIFWHRFSTSAQNGTWVSLPAVTEFYGNLNRFINNKYNMLVLLVIAAGIAIYIAIQKKVLHKFKSFIINQNILIVLIWFILPYTLMFCISFKVPMFIDRYILYTSIPFYLLIAVGFTHFIDTKKNQWFVSSLFIGSMLCTMQLNPDNNRRLKEVIAIVKDIKKENGITLLAPDYAYMGFAYHYNINYFKDAPNTLKDLNKDNVFPVHDDAQLNGLFAQDYPTCVYIQAGSEFSDPNNLIYQNITKRYKYHKQQSVYQIYLIHEFYN